MTMTSMSQDDTVPDRDKKAHSSSSSSSSRTSKSAAASGVTEEEEGSIVKSLFLLAVIFLCCGLLIMLVYSYFPKMDPDEYRHLKVIMNMEEAKNLAGVLSKYKDMYFYQVLLAYVTTFIFLQTFAIPGTIFLSIISGFLYPFTLALTIVCLCSGVGATLCYLLSSIVVIKVVKKFWADRIAAWRTSVDRHRAHLWNYMIFLRATPLLPNWFINITAPVVKFPLHIFFIGTVIGVAPQSFLMIQAGRTIYRMTSYGEVFTYTNIAFLAVFALGSILPVVYKEKLKEKLQ